MHQLPLLLQHGKYNRQLLHERDVALKLGKSTMFSLNHQTDIEEDLFLRLLHHHHGVSDVSVDGMERLRQLPPGDAALICPNHSYTGDGSVMIEVGRRRRNYLLPAEIVDGMSQTLALASTEARAAFAD